MSVFKVGSKVAVFFASGSFNRWDLVIKVRNTGKRTMIRLEGPGAFDSDGNCWYTDCDGPHIRLATQDVIDDIKAELIAQKIKSMAYTDFSSASSSQIIAAGDAFGIDINDEIGI